MELDGTHSELQFYDGAYRYYVEEKQRRRMRSREDFEAQEKARRRLEADIARTKEQARQVERSTRVDTSRRYAKKVAKKAKSRERRLARQMQSPGWLAEPVERPTLDLRLAGTSTKGKLLVRLDDVAAGYDDPLLAHLNVRVWGRDRVVINGPNGSGKTTLLRLIGGGLAPLSGEITTLTKIGYIPQVHNRLPLDQPVLDFFRDGLALYEYEARSFLGHFLFEQEQLRQPLGNLSTGQIRRLLLAKLMNAGVELLLLDEPTNYLDFDSIDVLEEVLRAFQGTLLIVTHDEYLTRSIQANRYWRVGQGTLVESPGF
jgi:ATPase subunit of ABC transporter with duplicated ATPase domains